jgi:hypothetical protein
MDTAVREFTSKQDYVDALKEEVEFTKTIVPEIAAKMAKDGLKPESVAIFLELNERLEPVRNAIPHIGEIASTKTCVYVISILLALVQGAAMSEVVVPVNAVVKEIQSTHPSIQQQLLDMVDKMYSTTH